MRVFHEWKRNMGHRWSMFVLFSKLSSVGFVYKLDQNLSIQVPADRLV